MTNLTGPESRMPHAALGSAVDVQNVSRSPMAWPPVSDMLADEVLSGAESGVFTCRDARDLVGVKAFRAAEAREARGNAVA